MPVATDRPIDTRVGCAHRLADLYARPGFKIRRAHQIAMAIFAEANAELGVTTTQFGILHTLAHIPDLDQIGLARLVRLDRSTTGLVLDLLEKRGWVDRVVHAEDRRRRQLTLTDQGRASFERMRRPAAQAVETLLADTGKKQIEQFLDSMERLVDAGLDGVEPANRGAMRDLYRRPGFLIRRAHQISSGLFVRECQAYDVTPTQYGVLYALERCPAIDQGTLAWLVRFDRSTTAMVVGLLENRGLIERRTDLVDRRRRVLNLTEAGRRLLTDVTPLARVAVDHLVQPLSAAERKLVMATLDDIIARLG
ncbi:hypothetical protein GCM10010862_28480 [Devosia nitrariae]|uniref:HTH marR-type domain-containing protein n=2 Tax=Devosia nitrariae TaxID=2071872 RepID=A0ABQ5W733_9HYPH|nr:hypothetical protein GCM10010862_28480 [Devosia nitrariae]